LDGQQVLDLLVVVVVVDVPARMVARHDVIDGALELDAESPEHRSICSGRSRN
jgi:hypothetical protein